MKIRKLFNKMIYAYQIQNNNKNNSVKVILSMNKIFINNVKLYIIIKVKFLSFLLLKLIWY